MKRNLIILSLLSTFALSACGIKGELKTPPPVWGEKSEQPSDQDSDSSNE